MSGTSKDSDFIADRYVNIKDPKAEYGEIMWYDRDIDREKTPTECVICIEAENEMYTKYAHPKAHLEAHTKANDIAESQAIHKDKYEYIDYYIFFYGKEYRNIYKELLNHYRHEYSDIVLGRKYNETDKICQHHLESIQYYYELNRSTS
jgi:hypothetical protein